MIKASWCFWVYSRPLRIKGDETCTFDSFDLPDNTNNHVSVTGRYRETIIPDFPPELVTVKFILGTPPYPEPSSSSEVSKRTKLLKDVKKEMKEHGDMVMLPVSYPSFVTSCFRMLC